MTQAIWCTSCGRTNQHSYLEAYSATGGSGTVSMVHARDSTNFWGALIYDWHLCRWTWLLCKCLIGPVAWCSFWVCYWLCHSVVQENGVLAHFCAYPPNTSSVRSFPVNNTWWPHILAYEVNIPELSGLVPLETLWAKPFKCHMSAVTRALFKSYFHWRTFSLLEYENVHLMGRCSSVHPLEVKGTCLEISYLWM